MAPRSMDDQGLRGFEQGMTADMCADWNAALAKAESGITPAERHGWVVGFLRAGWTGAVRSRATFAPAGKP